MQQKAEVAKVSFLGFRTDCAPKLGSILVLSEHFVAGSGHHFT